ncbi:MAG: hypothetical protein QM723_18555 [Myxococcaceae bacterium]
MLKPFFAMTLLAASPAGFLDVQLENADGDAVALHPLLGKPTIVFYEERDSTSLNQALKDELFKRGKKENLLDAVQVVAVADLQGYNWFPARNFALKGVRDAQTKAGIPVYVDWSGTMRGAPWKLKEKTSNVVLLDAAGALVLKLDGKVDQSKQDELFGALAGLLHR